MAPVRDAPISAPPPGSAGDVFAAFLRLGLTSFGGPVAHLGYFRRDLVERRGWIDPSGYAELVGFCQMLPGPTSSQVGFLLGLIRAGWRGAVAAWVGFTLPSAALMLLFAVGGPALMASRAGAGMLHGFGLAAVAVVAQAVWSLARTLCPDLTRVGIALIAAAVVVLAPASIAQPAAILGGGLFGLGLRTSLTGPGPTAEPPFTPLSRTAGAVLLTGFALLLAATLLGRAAFDPWAAFVRTGGLVFGGGHVVVPLLVDAIVAPGWVSEADFLAGYGAVQAMPGPLFSVAAYLGGVGRAPLGGVVAGGLAVVAIFLPGLLLAAGGLPFWRGLAARPQFRRAVDGVGAAVVGLLGAALCDPVWTGAVHDPFDAVIAVAALALLTSRRISATPVVALCGGFGALLG